MASPGEEQQQPRVSRGFLLGILRAALRPSRIDLAEVRKVLQVASVMGYSPVELYQEALQERPDNYAPPPLLKDVLPGDLPLEKQFDTALGEVLRRKREAIPKSSSASKSTSPKETAPKS